MSTEKEGRRRRLTKNEEAEEIMKDSAAEEGKEEKNCNKRGVCRKEREKKSQK